MVGVVIILCPCHQLLVLWLRSRVVVYTSWRRINMVVASYGRCLMREHVKMWKSYLTKLLVTLLNLWWTIWQLPCAEVVRCVQWRTENADCAHGDQWARKTCQDFSTHEWENSSFVTSYICNLCREMIFFASTTNR